MAFLRRLARVAGLAFSRTAERLLTWALEKPEEEASAGTEALTADSTEGPPAHWLEAIRAKAPWLLAGQRPGHRTAVLRPTVPPASWHPEQTPARGPEFDQDEHATNVVYKEREALNATSNRGERTPPELVRSRVPSQRPAPTEDLERPSRGESRGDHRPQYQTIKAEKPPGAQPPPRLEKPAGGQQPRLEKPPAGQQPPKPRVAGPPQLSEGLRGLALKVSQVVLPLITAAGRSKLSQAVVTPAEPPRSDHALRVFQDNPTEARSSPRAHQAPPTGPPQRRAAESAWPEEKGRPSARFHPVQWGERGRESSARQERPADGANGMEEDPWPQLPEWGWQQWQMDPIQRQFREWDRRARLEAEQAGSLWSGPPS